MMSENAIAIAEILGRHGYDMIESIGKKCFPTCFVVHNQRYNDKFACKVVYKKANYERELYALSILDHPNIVRLYDHFEESGIYFLILEYCKGGNLESLIKLHTRPKQERIINYTKQIVSALKYIHSKRLAHHDIKPSNILFDKYGRIKICDFGLSCHYNGESSKYFVGSFGYISPEQRANQIFNPFVADIWSFGVTIYFMTCGFNPFLQQKNSYKFILPMYVDKVLVHIITGTLAEDPIERISLNDIQSILTSTPRIAVPMNSWFNMPFANSLQAQTHTAAIKHGKSLILRV